MIAYYQYIGILVVVTSGTLFKRVGIEQTEEGRYFQPGPPIKTNRKQQVILTMKFENEANVIHL
ncbi:MAG: hypothetical protein HYV40_06935 [Candidatus Levybacteria bacterium]|nr:hypothetical protein [Candidatus Levybacteria bacterium]